MTLQALRADWTACRRKIQCYHQALQDRLDPTCSIFLSQTCSLPGLDRDDDHEKSRDIFLPKWLWPGFHKDKQQAFSFVLWQEDMADLFGGLIWLSL